MFKKTFNSDYGNSPLAYKTSNRKQNFALKTFNHKPYFIKMYYNH